LDCCATENVSLLQEKTLISPKVIHDLEQFRKHGVGSGGGERLKSITEEDEIFVVVLYSTGFLPNVLQ
jgi:hypothetical protein